MYRWVVAILVGAGVLVPAGVPGGVRADPPPEVRGLSVGDARTRLTAWSDSVVLQLVPATLPAGVDQSTVVVVTSTWLNASAQPGAAVVRPQVRLTLGSTVPDLTGSTPAAAARALAARGLTLRGDPAAGGPEWTVTTQSVPAGTIVEFGLAVRVAFAAPRTGPPLTLVALAGGGGLALLLLLGLLVLRGRRRARGRAGGEPAPAPAPEVVAVRVHPGPILGPDVSEAGPSVTVRLHPRYDPGTFTLEESPR